MVQRIAVFVAALWWGGISALSFLAVPMLFRSLGDPAIAGPVAARLFSFQSQIGLLLGALLLWTLRRMPVARATLVLILMGMLAAGLQEWGVATQIVSARSTGGNLRLWHSLGSVLVVLQWACAGGVLWRLAGRTDRP